MKTEFISLTDKVIIQQKLFEANPDAIKLVINELDRLESLIKAYEIGVESAMVRLTTDTFKSPNYAEIIDLRTLAGKNYSYLNNNLKNKGE